MMTPPPQTAYELGLMRGFPPAPDALVTHATQLLGPYNRWSFQHLLQLNRTADVWRGSGPVASLPHAPRDLSDVTYRNRAGTEFTFDDMVELSYTDGIVVLHEGVVIYERYLNGMQPHTLHAWASGSKSMTGTLAAMLLHEGHFAADDLVVTYLPELHASGWADATIRQVMDMTTNVTFADAAPTATTENDTYGIALGWSAAPKDYNGPTNVYDFLPTMRKGGAHDVRFDYLTANTDVLAWLIRRTLGMSLADAMHDRIWSRLGAERDAYWIVDGSTAETSGSGLVTTLPDMARFGQMMLDNGRFNGVQIVPAAVVTDIAAGADPAHFARGAAAGPSNAGYSYHHHWWNTHNEHGAYYALGYGGQMLYIDPAAHMVVAKMSSFPTPTPAGNEFYAAFAALPALGQALRASM